LPVFALWKVGPNSHQPGEVGGRCVPKRIPSGRWIDSTWITSAPRQPSTKVA
jgi:hypothetical protein